MNTSTIHYGIGKSDGYASLNRITTNPGSGQRRGSLACAVLLTLGALSAQAGAEATYKLFGREVGGYASKDDLPGIVTKALGSRASVADWDDIKKQYGQSEAGLKAFCDKLGLAPNSSAWVTSGGKRFWENERHYFVYRADHKLPEDFMLHDQVQDNFLLLGSWYDTRPVLVKLTDYNAADAAKFARWDEMLASKAKAAATRNTGLAGVYTLMAVNGQKLPATVSHEGSALQVRSGTFTINPDGTCSSKMTFVPPTGTEATVQTQASYSADGQKLSMQWQGAGRTTGTVAGSTFTMENEGMVFTYRK
jgi:hypothetical protein